MTARLLFDRCSYRTNISKTAVEQLNLSQEYHQQLKVLTFRSSAVQRMKTSMTELRLQISEGSFVSTTATVMPVITGDITTTAFSPEVLNRLQQFARDEFLQLADHYSITSSAAPVDILIGNDLYHDLMLPRKIELQPGIHLQESRLGWILSVRTNCSGTDNSLTHSLTNAACGDDAATEISIFCVGTFPSLCARC